MHGNPVHRHAVRHDGEAEAALVLIDPLEGVLLVLHVKLIEKRAAHRLGSRRLVLDRGLLVILEKSQNTGLLQEATGEALAPWQWIMLTSLVEAVASALAPNVAARAPTTGRRRRGPRALRKRLGRIWPFVMSPASQAHYFEIVVASALTLERFCTSSFMSRDAFLHAPIL